MGRGTRWPNGDVDCCFKLPRNGVPSPPFAFPSSFIASSLSRFCHCGAAAGALPGWGAAPHPAPGAGGCTPLLVGLSCRRRCARGQDGHRLEDGGRSDPSPSPTLQDSCGYSRCAGSCGVLPPAPSARRGHRAPPGRNAPTGKTRAVVFLASKETKSQTFSTLISLSCVLLLIPPHGHWSSDRRALQWIKGLLCSAVRGCRPLAGWCNQILPVPVPAPPARTPAPAAAGAGQGWSRNRGYRLDLPEPPPARPGLPSAELALSDAHGGGSKTNTPKRVPAPLRGARFLARQR